MKPDIDPKWAWEPFVPDAAHPWDRARAAHLYRRAGFGAAAAELEAALKRTPQEVIRDLVAAVPPAEMEATARPALSSNDSRGLSAWWLYWFLETKAPLLEKMTLFWHGHFATGAEKVQDAETMLQQNRTLRRHALGDFSAMVQEISRDAAMLIYLDSVTNRKSHPNENYAREVMELFCLGEGNYSEKDVQELARCFTGWEVVRRQFKFNSRQHDTGKKSVLGKTGEFGGEQAVAIVLEQAAAPRFIVRKLVRYFVFDEPAASDALLEPLAAMLREGGWKIGPVVARILGSNLFFSEHAVGRKVRSPIDVAVGLLRTLEASTDAHFLAAELEQLGQIVFFPPNVKGWDGGRVWINSATLLGRANLVRQLLSHEKTRFARGTLAALAERAGAKGPEATADWLVGLLLAVPVQADARARLVSLAKSGKLEEVIHAISTLPEFHLG